MSQENLQIALIQANQLWEDKEGNLVHYEQLLEQAEGSDLILLPEMFHTCFSMNASELAEEMETSIGLNWLKEQAAKKSCALYTSLIIKESGNYYNRGVFVEPNGMIHLYDKRNLFVLSKEHEHYSAGKSETIVDYKGWKINLQICYDLRFPENCRNYLVEGKPKYDLLLYVANWPERRIAHWNSLLVARAIENQCYVAAVNRVGTDRNALLYTGESKIINPLGELISNLSVKECVIRVTLDKNHLIECRTKMPFLK